jgi:Methyltransferase domain
MPALSKLRWIVLDLHWRLVRRPRLRRMSLEAVFSEYFQQHVWGKGGESISGGGSTTAATAAIRAALPGVLTEYGIKTLLDLPCGDGNWMNQVELDLDSYIGADIVPALIDLNISKWGKIPNRRFLQLDMTSDLMPRVDLVLCRDCLVHLSDVNAARALNNIKRSGSRYLLATTFPDHPHNLDIVDGEWRPINLQQAPFNLPPPLKLIREGLTEPSVQDKSLGLWRAADLASIAYSK